MDINKGRTPGKRREFALRTRGDLERFDKLSIEFGRSVGILVTDCPALRLIYDQLQGRTEEIARSLLPLAYDIKLSYIHAFYDISVVLGIENKLVAPEARAKFRPLESVESFAMAFRLYRAAFGLTARARAIWDKLFAYVGIEAVGPEFLRAIQGQKSKRKFFFRHFKAGVGALTPADIEQVRDSLENLESNFRTPELHGFGRIRTWAFAIREDWNLDEVRSLTGHWSVMHRCMHLVFRDVSTQQDSFGSRVHNEDSNLTIGDRIDEPKF